MLNDKQVKEEFRIKASKDPDKYYSTTILKQEDFSRKQCVKCQKYFWSTEIRERCGDPACSGGYKFIGNSPAKSDLDYISLWKEFAKLFTNLGYTPIERYPVVARWRDDTDFVQASIYNFQPYVVSGEIEPPANPLVVPQFSLRFNDIDNVGITGSHYTGFVMIGQHAFMPPEKWDQDQYFKDIHTWLKSGLGLPNNEIIFHEDAWAGGGNFGPCMEFFSRGLELGNQVYMLYEQTPQGNKELNLKVLDMGMGHERNAWFSKGSGTSYESTFPTVTEKLFKITGIEHNEDLIKKFLPYSSFLNVDEIADVEIAWKQIAEKLNIPVTELKNNIIPLSRLYSVAEHTRSLLFAINDGALPSNVAGGYNLRVILRRALGFIQKYNWNIDMGEVCDWHAKYLKPLFPELMENLEDVKKILKVEENKYQTTMNKSKQIVDKLLTKEIKEQDLIQLYDSQGISPEMIQDQAKKLGKEIKVPQDFYIKIAELHEKKEVQEEVKGKLQIQRPPDTEILYYEDPVISNFKARILNIINNKYIILDKTAFYPESGGQESDMGIIGNIEIVKVTKQGKIILHEFTEEPDFKEHDEVECKINLIRRMQLTKHHTATHIVNAAAKKVLGNHINQAGASKGIEKARLDITHYENISDEDIDKIEQEANEIITKNIKLTKNFFSRTEAEKNYGMRIYQGGAVPGKEIRIVEIPGIDIEACGGTHTDSTGEIEKIKILRSTKIQDGVVRIEFVAGEAADKAIEKDEEVLSDLARVLRVKKNEVPSRAEDLFEKWKLARKAVRKEQYVNPDDLELEKPEKSNLSEEELIKKTSEIFSTQIEHIVNTSERFIKELEKYKEQLEEIRKDQ